MPQRYSDKVRGECEAMYCLHDKSIPAISDVSGVSESTLRRWRERYNWDEKVVARVISGPMIAQQLKQQVYMITKQANDEARLITTQEADIISKLRKQIEDLDGHAIYVSHALEAMDAFNEWLADNAKPGLREEVVGHIMEFSRNLVRTESDRSL